MSEKNIPIYAGEEPDTSTQIGWASEEVDGGRAVEIDSAYRDTPPTKIWFGEPDPNAPVIEQPEPAPVDPSVPVTEVPEAGAEATVHTDAKDSPPVQTKKK